MADSRRPRRRREGFRTSAGTLAKTEFDLVILGGGAAAFAGAIRAHEMGLSSVMINTDLPIGGTCVNVGCIPSKFLLEVGNEVYYREHPRFACNLAAAIRCDFPEAIDNKNRLVEKLRNSYYRDIVEANDIRYIEGCGRLGANLTVRVDGQRFRGRHVLVATGARTRIPRIEGLSEKGYFTNRTLMEVRERPDDLMVLGGSTLGLEFAQMYAHFGTKVTVVESSDRILPNEEPEVSETMARLLGQEGIEFHVGARVHRIEACDGKLMCTVERGDGPVICPADRILVATGIEANVDGLEGSGVELTEQGHVRVQPHLATNVDGVWAAGDVVGRTELETVAAKEGALAVRNAFKGERRTIAYDQVPHAVFTNPQVGSVGLTEAELLRRGRPCECRTIGMDRIPKALTIGDTRGMLKMVIDAESRKIMGVHIVSPIAADMIHAPTYAVRAGFTVEDIIDIAHTFPTLSEAVKIAAESFVRDMSRTSCCTE